MPTTKVTTNGSVTLPAKFRKALGLGPGDVVSAELKNGAIVMRPARIVHADDAWYHTRPWREAEAEADEDIAAGRVHGPFDDAATAIGFLHTATREIRSAKPGKKSRAAAGKPATARKTKPGGGKRRAK
ncbi:MAG: AbrB/MazE/SpoVT family DNA-binding domain-containing protein [Deltaproteobacteria bacterium]|nr:AbrB/MazE/SpoVT family DNA-binding domain-containing protein [Deltaproteobacteria bacterium]